jgi:hypothetical protein
MQTLSHCHTASMAMVSIQSRSTDSPCDAFKQFGFPEVLVLDVHAGVFFRLERLLGAIFPEALIRLPVGNLAGLQPFVDRALVR